MSEEKAKEKGLQPLARIVGYSVAGVDPKIMGIGPAPAIRKGLESRLVIRRCRFTGN